MKKRLLLTAALLAALLLCGCSLFKSAQSLRAPDAAATEESLRPAEEPTEAPAEEPTEVPTEVPTEEPTEEPTEKPFGAEDLAGVWTMSGMLYGDREYSAAELEIESYFEFHEDGTVYCV